MALQSDQVVRGYLEEFERRASGEAGPVAEIRRAAASALERGGFPTVRDEDWKFTNVAPILRGGFAPTVGAEPESTWLEPIVAEHALGGDGPLLVFASGRFVADRSRTGDLAGGYVGSLASLLAEQPDLVAAHFGRALDAGAHGFAALNAALFEDGAAVVVPKGTKVEAPVEVLIVGAPADRPGACLPRNLIVLEEGASAVVVEHYVGDRRASYFTDAATEVRLGAGAELELVKIQDEAPAAYHVHRVEARQDRQSRLRAHTLSLGAALSRSELEVHLSGPEAECDLAGLALASGRRHVDHFTSIDHGASHTRSTQLYKGVCSGASRAVFTGKVLVREGTEKVSAEQTNRNLLLSEHALVETRPQLEIYADDVRCSHGATVGRLDQDMVFYLRQRGIDEAEARKLLTYAFASGAVDSLPAGRLREAVATRLHERLDAGGELGDDRRGEGGAELGEGGIA